jgi:hypothetical protein
MGTFCEGLATSSTPKTHIRSGEVSIFLSIPGYVRQRMLKIEEKRDSPIAIGLVKVGLGTIRWRKEYRGNLPSQSSKDDDTENAETTVIRIFFGPFGRGLGIALPCRLFSSQKQRSFCRERKRIKLLV